MPRISKVSTKTGDDGTTGLADGTRLSKHDLRVHLLGEIDELNAFIGLTISSMTEHSTLLLLKIQHDLFDIGAEICQPGKQLITADYVATIDTELDKLNEKLPPLKEFILPGGSNAVAQLHVCRTICRRCERTASSMLDELNPITLQYLNRLSDLLFVYSRFIAHQSGNSESYWNSDYSRK